ncbi:glycine-rich RNA-binding protein 3, mitochondrial isoform X2 [Vigna radiata var. radiata]|uniref:Glycine-rich RNA-binding protein 3, mitochondrial isoform X2 n=1 Tax=Vigna radiata var. radiata TaxID=3916 RepID=A0A3Q0F0H3_VIGRR|nr:glycine-rich RNA-binding protein 3, mitochondrial isoform X2 [Vigna radiata var. radiata]
MWWVPLTPTTSLHLSPTEKNPTIPNPSPATVPVPAQFIKHFGKYGEITDSVIMKDRKTGQPRGFGFITYADPSVVDKVIEDPHVINGKQVEIKRTIPRGAVGSKDFRTKKIFVGGIPSNVTEDEFRDFFTRYGEVKDHQIMRDHSTNRSRGFGFITFDSEEAVDDLLSMGNKIEFAGAQVEIKKAEPKKPNSAPPSSKRYNDSRSSYGGAGYGDAYDGFGGNFGVGGGYRSGGAYGGGRAGAYGAYGSEFGGYGGYAGAMGPYRGDPSLSYAGRYGGSFSRGYDLGGYGGPSENYGAYGGGGGSSGGAGAGAYQSGYDGSLGGGYGGTSGGPFYGSSRGGYGAGRYHPYGR